MERGSEPGAWDRIVQSFRSISTDKREGRTDSENGRGGLGWFWNFEEVLWITAGCHGSLSFACSP